MRYVFAGFRLMARDRSLWKYALKPLAMGAFVYICIVALGFIVVPALSAEVAARLGAQGDGGSTIRSISAGLGAIVFGLIVWFASGFLYLTVTSLFSAFLWDKLNEEVEARLGILEPAIPVSSITLLTDSLVRLVLSIGVSVAGIIASWSCLAVGGILAAGWLGLHDYTSPAYLRRNQPIWIQLTAIYGRRGWLAFLLVSGMLTLIPLINVLCLPALVAAGTMLRAQKLPETQAK